MRRRLPCMVGKLARGEGYRVRIYRGLYIYICMERWRIYSGMARVDAARHGTQTPLNLGGWHAWTRHVTARKLL